MLQSIFPGTEGLKPGHWYSRWSRLGPVGNSANAISKPSSQSLNCLGEHHCFMAMWHGFERFIEAYRVGMLVVVRHVSLHVKSQDASREVYPIVIISILPFFPQSFGEDLV